MSRKLKLVIISISAILLIGIIFILVYLMNGNGLLEREKTIEELYEDGEILTRDEISDVVDKYLNQNPMLLGDYEISEKLREDYNDMVAHMYLTGYMIDDSFSDEDNQQVMAWADINKRKYTGLLPVKKIVNPIDYKADKEKENRLHRISDIYSMEHDEKMYFKDTKGFYYIDGLYIGYPFLSGSSLKDGELTTYLHFKILIQDNIQLKDLDDFFKKYNDIEVNGKKMTEDLGVYSKKDDKEFWDEFFVGGDDNVFLKNNVLDVRLRLPLNDIFKRRFPSFQAKYVYKMDDNEYETYSNEVDRVFGLDPKDEIEEKPVININGKRIELSNEIIMDSDNKYKGDVEITPEVIDVQ